MKREQGRIIGKRTIFRKGDFRVDSLNYQTPSGMRKELLAIPRKSVVVIVPVLPDGKFVLVRQFRPPAGKWVLSFPAGKIDGKESPRIAAKRELLEEAGYSSGKITLLGTPFIVNPASGKHTVSVFLAEKLEFRGQKPDWDEEGIETITVSWAELTRLAENGKLTANHLAALFLYCQKSHEQNKQNA